MKFHLISHSPGKRQSRDFLPFAQACSRCISGPDVFGGRPWQCMLPPSPSPSSSFVSKPGGKGIHPPKLPKNPRLGDSDGDPQSSKLGHWHHPEETESRSGPAPSAEQNREEPGQAASRYVAQNIPASLSADSGHSTVA